MKKKITAIFLCISMLMLTACEMLSLGADSGELVLATGGTDGTYFAVGGSMATVLNPLLNKSSISVLSTGGSKSNINMLSSKEAQLAIVQNDVMYYAYTGTDLFQDEGKYTRFSAIAGLYDETVQIVTCNDNIKTIEDLKGKKVCVGDAGSGTEFNARQILDAYGMSFDDIEVVNASFGDSTDNLAAGKLDAAFMVAGTPTKAVAELAERKNIRLIGIDDSHIEKIQSKYQFYSSATIESGTYENVDEDVQTVSMRAVLVASNDVSESEVNEILTNLFDKKDDLAKEQTKFNELSLEDAVKDISIPFHAGAKKYYEKQGISGL